MTISTLFFFQNPLLDIENYMYPCESWSMVQCLKEDDYLLAANYILIKDLNRKIKKFSTAVCVKFISILLCQTVKVLEQDLFSAMSHLPNAHYMILSVWIIGTSGYKTLLLQNIRIKHYIWHWSIEVETSVLSLVNLLNTCQHQREREECFLVNARSRRPGSRSIAA